MGVTRYPYYRVRREADQAPRPEQCWTHANGDWQREHEARIAAHAARVAADLARMSRSAAADEEVRRPAKATVAVDCAHCGRRFWLTPWQHYRRNRSSISGRLYCGQACGTKGGGGISFLFARRTRRRGGRRAGTRQEAAGEAEDYDA